MPSELTDAEAVERLRGGVNIDTTERVRLKAAMRRGAAAIERNARSCGCRDLGDGTGVECATHEGQRLALEQAEQRESAATSERDEAYTRLAFCKAEADKRVAAISAALDAASDREATLREALRRIVEIDLRCDECSASCTINRIARAALATGGPTP